MYVVSAGTFDAIPPLTLGVLRLVIGVAVLAAVFRGRLGLAAAPKRRMVAAGAVVAVTMVMQFVGTSLTGGAEGALLTTTTPAFVLVFGVLLEGERVRRIAWAGCIVALAGVVVLADLGSAVMAAKLALDMVSPETAARTRLSGGPLVEGAVVAAVQASIGDDVGAVVAAAEEAANMPKDVR